MPVPYPYPCPMSISMATTTTASTASSNVHRQPSELPRSSAVRRLSQLRTYAQHHLPSHSASHFQSSSSPSSSSSPAVGRRSSGLANRLSWLAPAQSTPRNSDDFLRSRQLPRQQQQQLGTGAPCLELPEQSVALSRYTSAPSASFIFGNNNTDNNNSNSLQLSNHMERRSSSGMMARLRGANRLSRTVDSLHIAEGRSASVDMTPGYTPGRQSIEPNPLAEIPIAETNPMAEAASRPSTDAAAAVPPPPPPPPPQQQHAPTENSTSSSAPANRKATIRFFPYHDHANSAKPSLPFVPMTRILPVDRSVIRVGRYSERDGAPAPNPSEPSDSPIGFKSKVVSRKHCEFVYMNDQWHIKDVGSSSGTFLNHMRLSQPSMVSRLYAVKDGDIVQLGIDFRGGDEMIFRCVRIRVECNRSWQQRPNEFKYVHVFSRLVLASRLPV